MSTFRHRPSPAMVVACLALAVALGGTSYAAITLPANSVGTKQLKKNAVTRPKIKAGAVSGAKVAFDSLTGANILESSLGAVPSATNAGHATSADSATNSGHATSADSATSANRATSADTATNAAHAANSDKLGGLDSSAFVLGSTVRQVGPIATPYDNPNKKVLATIGQLSFDGECWDIGGTQAVRLVIQSSVGHAAYADMTLDGAGTAFGEGDMAAGGEYPLAQVAFGPFTRVFTPVSGAALSADGHQIFYDLYMGQNARTDTGDACVFGGSFVVN